MSDPPHDAVEAASIWPKCLPAHPRLLADAADWSRLRDQIKTDATSQLLWSALMTRATAICNEPPLRRTMTGRLLLMISRQALERISVLALVDRISEDRRFGRRAVDEMLALCAFSDWNPSHFLDTAELCLAVATGYDWLYDLLSPEQADIIRNALIQKGITPSLDSSLKSNWWLSADENWVQVCHGGLVAAAIAVGDRVPELASTVLVRALAALPTVATRYGPDGAYPEGPMYWSYGTAYHVVLAAALHRLTGSTQGVDDYPGFAESAEYIRQVTGPSGKFFNYADCAPERRLQAQLFWMSARFNRPDWLAHDIATLERDLSEYIADPGVQYWYYDMVAFALLWHRPAALTLVPEASHWSAAGPMPVALYRWGDGFFLGVKGGSVGLSHSHMDVGSFVLEAGGERWAVDPGMQDYESLESAGVDLWNEREPGSQRWTVFRIGADAHNILRVAGIDQPLFCSAPLDSSAKECRVDLSGLFSGGNADRHFTIETNAVRMVDRWSTDAPIEVVSQWLTRANVERDGRRILLRQGKRSLLLEVGGDHIDRIEIEDVSEPRQSFDAPNPGLTRITLRSLPSRSGRFQVEATLLHSS